MYTDTQSYTDTPIHTDTQFNTNARIHADAQFYTNVQSYTDTQFNSYKQNKSNALDSATCLSHTNFLQLLPLGYTVGSYSRLSQQDDLRDESNSITNQRAMIKNHVATHGEFADARVIEYVDDGISGSHTDREAYQRLMSDVERGVVQCIIVKDLSRIVRNLIDVDDLLMNYLVTQGVRFIAINNHYDSMKNPLSNLELAIINLTNQHYNRDIAQKSISSRITKMKRGEYLSCWALFGYKKSESERNKIIIDEESATYVRMIFSHAVSGNSLIQIAIILNAQGIPTPSEYKKKQSITGFWKMADPDFCFWNYSLVARIFHDIRYTGVAVNHMMQVKSPSRKSSLLHPKEEWIMVPDAHEAIITKAEYDMAHKGIHREKLNDIPVDHIFYDKIKCPVCCHTLKRLNPRKSYFRCRTRYYTDHYDCPDCSISQADIEKVVLECLKTYAATRIDQEDLKLSAISQNGISKAEIENRIKSVNKAIQTFEESVTKNIATLVSGQITQDEFLSKKEIINVAKAQKNDEMVKLREQLEAISIGKEAIEERLSTLRPLLAVEKLDRVLVDMLIDKVLVYREDHIEIIWLN